MSMIWVELTNFFENTLREFSLISLLDVIIVAVIIYQLLKLIRRTRADQLLKGLVFVLFFMGFSYVLNLQALYWMLRYIIDAGVIVIIILFQPELRSALEHFGRRTRIDIFSGGDGAENSERTINEIIRALLNLSRRKVGALIVIEQQTGLNDIAGTGTLIGGVVSSALLENIFEPNTPLHDGAVVIKGSRVVAAGCFLRLTEDHDLSRELGTRHRAAIGITETSDCLSLIVSEETGVISCAQGGKLTRYLDNEHLMEVLKPAFETKYKDIRLTGIFKRKGAEDEKREI